MTIVTVAKTDREMTHLRHLALRMGGLAEEILNKSLLALWNSDRKLAEEVVQDDLAIDRIDVEIDAAVLSLLALRAPVASDLRHTLAVKTIATDLERIGDLARNIANSVQRLAQPPPMPMPALLRDLAAESRRALNRAMQSFADLDVDLARSVLEEDDAIDEAEDRVIRESISRLHLDPTYAHQEVDVIFIAQNLERVADHATNIAEEVILATESINLKHAEKLSLSGE